MVIPEGKGDPRWLLGNAGVVGHDDHQFTSVLSLHEVPHKLGNPEKEVVWVNLKMTFLELGEG